MTWLVYASPVDASTAAALVSRRYIRLTSQTAAEGKLVAEGTLVDGAGVPDEELGPFTYVLPGRRSGALTTDGVTERWALPAETAGGAWALPLPDGWAATDVAGLPNGYTEAESVELAGDEP